jgi:hypothetical protein
MAQLDHHNLRGLIFTQPHDGRRLGGIGSQTGGVTGVFDALNVTMGCRSVAREEMEEAIKRPLPFKASLVHDPAWKTDASPHA